MSDRSIKVSDVKKAWAIIIATAASVLWIASLQAESSANRRWIETRTADMKTEEKSEQAWREDVVQRLARIEQAVGATGDRRMTQTAGNHQ